MLARMEREHRDLRDALEWLIDEVDTLPPDAEDALATPAWSGVRYELARARRVLARALPARRRE